MQQRAAAPIPIPMDDVADAVIRFIEDDSARGPRHRPPGWRAATTATAESLIGWRSSASDACSARKIPQTKIVQPGQKYSPTPATNQITSSAELERRRRPPRA